MTFKFCQLTLVMPILTLPVEKRYMSKLERIYLDKKMWGRIAVIVRALSGLKSAGASWRAHLSQPIRDLGFKPTIADNDVCRKPSIDQ